MQDAKVIILGQVTQAVEKQIENAERGRAEALKESRFHKGAMASRYDTFKEEAQYLADGHAVQLVEFHSILNTLKSLLHDPPTITHGSLYALVEVEDIEREISTTYFLLPTGGGNIYEVNGRKITVLNVSGPIARAFIGAVADDEVEVDIQGKTKEFRILSVV